MLTDSYQTIASPSEGEYKEKGSKFLAYAYPMDAESDLDGFMAIVMLISWDWMVHDLGPMMMESHQVQQENQFTDRSLVLGSPMCASS